MSLQMTNGNGNGNGNGNRADPSGILGLFHRQLGDIQLAERQAATVFPDMATVATDESVASIFRAASAETEVQLARLRRLAEGIGVDLDEAAARSPDGGRAIEALLSDTLQLLNGDIETPDGDLDEKMVRSARRSVAFQIAGYEALCATARRLGDYAALDILLQSLDDELSTDASLAGLVSDGAWMRSAS